MATLNWGDEKEMKKPPIDDPLNRLSVFRYVLNSVWEDLSRNSSDCECCDTVSEIKLRLAKLCNDLEIKIKMDD